MLEVICYDEEKGEMRTLINGTSAVLSFDPQSHTAGIWKLIFRAMAEEAVEEHGQIQVK